MVPAAAACAGDVLPVCAAERVRAAIVCQRLQGPVYGGEPGPVTGPARIWARRSWALMKVPAAASACLIASRRAVMRTHRDF